MNDDYVAFLVQEAALAVVKAYDAAVPAHLAFAEAVEPDQFRPIWSS